MGSRIKAHYYELVEMLAGEYAVSTLLTIGNLSRSAFYKWRNKQQRVLDLASDGITQQIQDIHRRYPFYGYRRITIALRRIGIIVNHKRVYRLMKKLGLQSTIRKKRRYFGRKGSSIFPNVLNREFVSDKPRTKLVTDITYLPVTSGFLYLSVVQDLYNNEIVSHCIGEHNSLPLVLDTVTSLNGEVGKKAVLHSDQGFQYTSGHYKQKLQLMGIQGSHSRKGNCLDNACIESFFSHLKTEALPRKRKLDTEEMISCVEGYIDFYNKERFQKKFGQLSPIEYREKLAA